MNIHEYQAKEVLRAFGVPTGKGTAAFTVDEAVKAAESQPGGDPPLPTCHQAAYKPHLGASMLKDYPELNKAKLVAAAYTPVAAAPVALVPGGVLGKILFAVGKKDIDADGQNAIATAAKMLAEKKDANVGLSGFADKTGNPTSNLALAKDRAVAVRDALKAAGVAENRIQLKKPEFIVGGSAADSRRVDIVAAP